MISSCRFSFAVALSGLLSGSILCDRSQAQGTFTGLSFLDGLDAEAYSEEYWTVDDWVPGGPPPSSSIDTTSFFSSSPTELASGSASAELGVLRARATGASSGPVVLSVAGFTDTITIFADGQGGEAGTLHLEYELDGTVNVGTGAFGSVSIDLLNADLPELENLDDPNALEGVDTYDSQAETFIDFSGTGGLTQTFEKGVNPLMVSLDIPITFGTPINYGAALFLLLAGEGDLDFSNTLEFTDATVSDAIGQTIINAGVASNAGISYGGLNAVPEPSVAFLMIASFAIGLGRRRR